jgi:hypothetical protein
MIIELIHLGITKSLDIMSRSKYHLVTVTLAVKHGEIASGEKNVIMLMTTYIISHNMEEATVYASWRPTIAIVSSTMFSKKVILTY